MLQEPERHRCGRRRGAYRNTQAEQQLREVLAARLRVLGPDHRNTLATRHEIARMLDERGQYEQAEREYRDVLAAEMRILGPDHPDIRVTRDSLTMLEIQARRPSREPADYD